MEFTLARLIQQRAPACGTDWTKHLARLPVAYAAVARSGSESLQIYLGASYPHNHDCTVADLERKGARFVYVALRHPVERIASGVKRRLEMHQNDQPNQLFVDTFHGADAMNSYIRAIQDHTHPQHAAALQCTLGRMRQAYMLPVSEFYLAGSMNRANILFVCTDTLITDFNAQAARWDLPLKVVPNTSLIHHKSYARLNDLGHAQRAWIHRTYHRDVALWHTHCNHTQT